MRQFSDGCGRQTQVPTPVSGVVSLCPSHTQTLVDIGAPLVGRTRYCIHPADAVAEVPELGGTKNPNLNAIFALQPDLVIAEREENRAEDVDALAAQLPVYVTDVRDWDDGLRSVAELGALCERDSTALVHAIETAWAGIARARPMRTLYLIWRKPWMAVGGDTYIDAVLSRIGLDNLAAPLPGRYPELDAATLQALAPELCLLSSEPFPFAEAHAAELRELLPECRFEFVSGETFSWYGSRMLAAAAELQALVARL